MKNTISFSGEKLDFTLKIYQGNEARIKKLLQSLHSRMEKLSTEKETLEKELSEVQTVINQIMGEEPTPENEVAAQPETMAVTTITPSNYGYEIAFLGIDTSEYQLFSWWEEKIDFILKNAPMALQRRDIIKYLRGLDDKYKLIHDDVVIKKIAPYLSRMSMGNRIIAWEGHNKGYYYIHPSWIENGVIKPEFKDKCPEKLRIVS